MHKNVGNIPWECVRLSTWKCAEQSERQLLIRLVLPTKLETHIRLKNITLCVFRLVLYGLHIHLINAKGLLTFGGSLRIVGKSFYYGWPNSLKKQDWNSCCNNYFDTLIKVWEELYYRLYVFHVTNRAHIQHLSENPSCFFWIPILNTLSKECIFIWLNLLYTISKLPK